jgi:putative oxidoreductase
MKRNDFGLLLIRISAGGFMMYFHGWEKIGGGTDKWTELGGSMNSLGIHFAPALWGFLSACIEFFGGLCVLLGFRIKYIIPFLLINMLVAIHAQFSGGSNLADASHAMEYFLVYAGLWFTGSGKYSLDEVL